MPAREASTEIQHIIDVFQEYIRQVKNAYGWPKYDIVYLENLQCYLLVLNFSEENIIAEHNLITIPISVAEDLYVELISDIVQEHCIRSGLLELSAAEITEKTREQIELDAMAELEPYIEALPEYRSLTERIVKEEMFLFFEEFPLKNI